MIVRVDDGYADARFTTSSGVRIILTGEVVEVEDGYTGGGDAGTYRYIGGNARLDLGAQDYSDTASWVLIAGESGRAYRYLGAASLAGADLSLIDYTDPLLWVALGGDEGVVYEWMGPDGTLVDLGNADYSDLGWWKPLPQTSILPQGLNVTGSDAIAVGGIVVLNDLRTHATARISGVTVTAAGVLVQALEEALMRAITDATVVSSGGASFPDIDGDSIAVAGVIATNVVLSEARATITGGSITTTGDVLVDAENIAQLDAETRAAVASASQNVGVTLAFNSIGWKSQNFLFNLIDTIIGTPALAGALAGPQPAIVEARITGTTVAAGGEVAVIAVNAGVINAEVSNEAPRSSSWCGDRTPHRWASRSPRTW